MNSYNLQQSLELAGVTISNRVLSAVVAHAKATEASHRAAHNLDKAAEGIAAAMNPPDTCHRCGR